MIKGAIFDADGTMMNTTIVWSEIGERYITSTGRIPEPDLDNVLYSMSFEEGVSYLKEEYGIHKTEDRIRAEIIEMIHCFYREEAQLKPGLVDFLEALSKLNIPMVVATTNDGDLIEETLERLGIRKYFKEVLNCQDFNSNKREPLIYLEAAKKLNCIPGETLVFEDVLYALETAKSAGFITVGVEDICSSFEKDKIVKSSNCYLTNYLDFEGFWAKVNERK